MAQFVLLRGFPSHLQKQETVITLDKKELQLPQDVLQG